MRWVSVEGKFYSLIYFPPSQPSPGHNIHKSTLGFLAKNLFAAMKPEINSLKDDLKGE